MINGNLHRKKLFPVFLLGFLLLPYGALAVPLMPQPIFIKLPCGIFEERETIKEITPKNIPLQFEIQNIDLYNDGRLFYTLVLLNPEILDHVYFRGRFIGYKHYSDGVDVLKIENGVVYERISEESWQRKGEDISKIPIEATYYDNIPKYGGRAREWIVEGRINGQPFLVRGGHHVPFLTRNVLLGLLIFASSTVLLWVWTLKRYNKII